MRVEVFYKKKYIDGRANRLLSSFQKHFSTHIYALRIVDVYIIEGIDVLTEEDLRQIFADQVAQDILINKSTASGDLLPDWNTLVEISYKPGVTDPIAITAKYALENYFEDKLPENAVVQTAVKYLFNSEQLSSEEEKKLLLFLHNPLIQTGNIIKREEWEQGRRFPSLYPYKIQSSLISVETFDISNMDEEKLKLISKERILALSVPEMKAIQFYFQQNEVKTERRQKGLTAEITDVELEMIAQTWSEHCKHKIFNAIIHYWEGNKEQTITSLFKTYIKNTTDKLSKSKKYLRSVFHDNSGVIQFDNDTLLCFKVETHNSPSALDPYGGAITGIVGVNRDIIGTGIGAKPIFNTNFLCFGYPDTKEEEIPAGILHPFRVLSGVHKGIIDGGNQSGIPVVAGGFLFDESYLGKPIVYCGTGGILPAKILGTDSFKKQIKPGALAVMVGGRIGKDGIHGATFSSQELSETSPTSAVQIGDPITQKKMLDFLIEARDLGLYSAITDNGAGGLSSSLGEMASLSGGVRILLDKCPLKYKGLAPWEILVSESQERMSLAVLPEEVDAFLNLAKARDVEATVVGAFTDSGYIEVLYDDRYVGLIGLDFLHEGLPQMELKAVWNPKEDNFSKVYEKRNIEEDLLGLLKEPNIASKEILVRQYDHEVQALSVVKPFTGAMDDGHSDGAVLKPLYDSQQGITVTHGICPRYGDYDTYHMAMCAVDEAFRAHIALGGDPSYVSALDNFCWPDPIESASNPDAHHKLAQLVRACKGLHDACMEYRIPLISGKDSMKNDACVGGRKISVRPTLLISLMGIIQDISLAITTDFKQAGDIIFILGNTNGELGGTRFERYVGGALGKCPEVITTDASFCYFSLHQAIKSKLVSSCHDISDGGLAVALCESAHAGRLGAKIQLSDIPGKDINEMEDYRLLFCESPSRFIVSVSKQNLSEFCNIMKGVHLNPIGEVLLEQQIYIKRDDRMLINLTLEKIEKAWKTPIE